MGTDRGRNGGGRGGVKGEWKETSRPGFFSENFLGVRGIRKIGNICEMLIDCP